MDAVSRSGKIAAPLGSRRGRMVDLGGLVEQTMESIEAWMVDHPGTWVALSGGKDSTAVAHLARRVDPSTPLVFYDSGAEFPQTLRWMERTQEEWGGIVRIPAVPDAVSLFEQEGFLTGRPTDGKQRSSRSLHRVLIEEPEACARRMLGCDWNLLGLRADESPGRSLALVRGRGETVRHDRGGEFVSGSFSPIWRWRAAHVHTYLTRNRVPMSSLYRDLERLGVEWEHSRVSLMLDGNCLRRGRWALTYRLAPNRARAIEERLPLLRSLR